MTSRLVLAATIISLAPFSVCAAGPPETLNALRQAKSEKELDQVIAEFNRSNIELIQSLTEFLGEAKTPEAKVRACFLLGETRSPRATRALVEHILLQVESPERYTKTPLWGPYPCQDALAKIGKAAEDVLLETLAGHSGHEVKAAALKVLQRIEGWRGAVFMLEQAWERAGLEERKSLEKIIEQARKEAGS